MLLTVTPMLFLLSFLPFCHCLDDTFSYAIESYKAALMSPTINPMKFCKTPFNNIERIKLQVSQPPFLNLGEHAIMLNGAIRTLTSQEIMTTLSNKLLLKDLENTKQISSNIRITFANRPRNHPECPDTHLKFPSNVNEDKQTYEMFGSIRDFSTLLRIQLGLAPRGIRDPGFGMNVNSKELLKTHERQLELNLPHRDNRIKDEEPEQMSANGHSRSPENFQFTDSYIRNLGKTLFYDAFLFNDAIMTETLFNVAPLKKHFQNPNHCEETNDDLELFFCRLSMWDQVRFMRSTYGELWWNWRNAILVSASQPGTTIHIYASRLKGIINDIALEVRNGDAALIKDLLLHVPERERYFNINNVEFTQALFAEADLMNYFFGFPIKIELAYQAYLKSLCLKRQRENIAHSPKSRSTPNIPLSESSPRSPLSRSSPRSPLSGSSSRSPRERSKYQSFSKTPSMDGTRGEQKKSGIFSYFSKENRAARASKREWQRTQQAARNKAWQEREDDRKLW